MADLLFLVLTVVCFAGTAGFVFVCERIIGPDSDHGDPQGAGEADLSVAPVDAALATGADRR